MKKTFICCMTAILTLCLLCFTASAFTFEVLDNDQLFDETLKQKETVSDWAVDDVNAARAAGLIPALSGTPGYQDTITREQFAELVVQTVTVLCGAPDAAPAGTFTDTSNPVILQAYQTGIVSGVGDQKFAPAQTTNREQIAVMIARAAAYIKAETGVDLAPAAADIGKYADKEEVSAWAVDGVGTLAANGIMAGTSATTLSPKASCTVEQSILLLYRVYDACQKAA